MSEANVELTIEQLPIETLLKIISYLPCLEVVRLGRVCRRWLSAAAHVLSGAGCEAEWRRLVEAEFPAVARRGRLPRGLRWLHSYRALRRWPQLAAAAERRREFARVEHWKREINRIVVLQNGTLAVLTKSDIAFYDIETLELTDRPKIQGNFTKYTEIPGKAIALLDHDSNLLIVRELDNNPSCEPEASFDGCYDYIIVDTKVYFLTWDDPQPLYAINLLESKLRPKYITSLLEETGLQAVGYTTQLNFLSCDGLFFIKNRRLKFSKIKYNKDEDFFPLFKKYDLNEMLNLDITINVTLQTTSLGLKCYTTLHQLSKKQQSLKVRAARVHADMIFVGTQEGILLIYHSPDGRPELTRPPTKQYNLNDPTCPAHKSSFNCAIDGIEVVDGKDGHTVFVMMTCMIIVFNYTYSGVHDWLSMESSALPAPAKKKRAS